MSKEEIKKMVLRGNPNIHSHVLICFNHFTFEYFPKYVGKEEMVDRIMSETTSNMVSVEEVYCYDLDLEFQFSEPRTYHIDKVKEALAFATKMHEGQTRRDGTPYITHPIRVSKYVEKYKSSHDLDTLKMSAYLHDTLEDTGANYYDLVFFFGPLVASIVLELTTDEDMKKALGKTKYLELKMKNMSSWALVIKLCDRLDNVSDLASCEKEFRTRYTKETIAIIEFVLQNRNLSKTHLQIIKDIIQELCIQNEFAQENIESLQAFQKVFQKNYFS